MLQVYDVLQCEKTALKPDAMLAVAAQSMMAQSGWTPKHKAVFIKPNVGASSLNVNTDPAVVRGIIHYLQGIDITDIVIGEGAVESESGGTSANFQRQGWDLLAKQEKVGLVDLNKCGRLERFAYPWKYDPTPVMLPKVMKNRSYINVAKMKTHMQTLVSLCTKNQKGLLDIATRKNFHKWGLHDPIARLGEAVSPELCVVDGYYGIEGNGPGDWGTRKKVGLLIGGDSMVEVDCLCCEIMGISFTDVKHLRLLRQYTEYGDFPSAHLKNVAHIWDKKPFKLPDASFKKFKIHLHITNACSACIGSVGGMTGLAKSWAGVKVFSKKGLLTRLDIILGSPKDIPDRHGHLIFYGECAKKLASRYGDYPFIQGCPPDPKRALEQLAEK
jgi:uncharacterized protein (DUF362 family)